MILDKKLHGIVDQGSGCLIIFAEPKDNVRGALSAPFSPALYANAPSRLLYFCFRSHVSAENLHRGAADHEQHEQGHGLAVQAHRKAFLDRLLLANLCGPVPATKMRCVHGLHHRLYKGVVGRHESQRVRHGSDGPLMQRRRSFQVVQPELKPDPGQPDVCEQRTNRPGFVSDVQGTARAQGTRRDTDLGRPEQQRGGPQTACPSARRRPAPPQPPGPCTVSRNCPGRRAYVRAYRGHTPASQNKCRRECACPERVWDGSPALIPLVKGARRPDAAEVRHLDDRVRRQLDQADGVRILVCNLIE